MTNPVDGDDIELLALDLVEWVAKKPRRYSEVIDAWRTSCPIFPVLEDAPDRRLIKREKPANGERAGPAG